MSSTGFALRLLFLAALLGLCPAAARAQDERKDGPPREAAEQAEDDVISVDTKLIQTGVAVFDKQGRFVEDLRLEDFEVTVDGKPVPVSFFEQSHARRGADARPTPGRGDAGPAPRPAAAPAPAGRGRNVLFVVDDLHLSFESHHRVRKLISQFIEQEMTAEDTAAIISSTGKVGFLQQFTGDKVVLRAAVERLVYGRDRSANNLGLPPMTEYEALLISQLDRQVTDIFAAYESGADIESRREVVRSRARTVLSYAASVNRGTYATLEQAIRSSTPLAGRKVVFFISDGFLLDPSNTDASHRVRRITDAAARANAVIFSLDAKGLEAGFPDGTTSASPAVGHRVQSGERFERQDGLSLLAEETGGRFVRHTNDLGGGLTRSLDEAARYYLLAWRPVTEDGRSEKLRKIEVRVRNRPELKVRAHVGYIDGKVAAGPEQKEAPPAKKGKNAEPPLSIADRQLTTAATAPVAARALPVALSVSFLSGPNREGAIYVASQVNGESVEFTPQKDGETQAHVDILGLVYDSRGTRVGLFRELLTAVARPPAAPGPQRRDIYHNYQTKLKPGLYQIRVAARDAKSGAVGSAVQWIDIPDLSAGRLALSSLILNEQAADGRATPAGGAAVAGEAGPRLTVDRRLPRTSRLRYLVFIYNAARGRAADGRPDVTVQTRVLRGKDVVLESPARPLSAEGQDPASLPYAAEIALGGLPPGRYELTVLVHDRAAKTDSARRVSFEVE